MMYKTHEKIMAKISDNKCISLCIAKISTGEEKLVAVLQQSNKKTRNKSVSSVNYLCTDISIKCKGRNPTYFGQTYYYIEITNFNQVSIQSNNIQKYIVGLPYKHRYCFIASDWTDMDYEYTTGLYIFHLPKI